MFGYFPMSGGAYQAWVGNAKPTEMVRNMLQYLRLDPALRVEKIRQWNVPVWWPLWLLGGLALLGAWLIWRAARRRDQATAVAAPQGTARARLPEPGSHEREAQP
jgi:cytochrome c-type biogenesis protein CcmH/NrfF